MATPLETIYSWFQTGDFPTEVQFQQTFASFRHKDTPITAGEIQGLAEMFNGTASISLINNHLEDAAAHINYLAAIDGSNITGDAVATWRVALGIGPAEASATIDVDDSEGNVYTKEQTNAMVGAVAQNVDAHHPYRVYKAFIHITAGTFEPEFVVIQNTLGDVVWARASAGHYVGTLQDDFFTSDKVAVLTKNNANTGTSQWDSRGGRVDDTKVFVTLLECGETAVPTDVAGAVGFVEIYDFDDPFS